MFTFPKELRWLLDAMAAVASKTYTATSTPIQYASITAFEENEVITEQLKNARRILRIVGNYLHTRLKKLEINCPKPQDGFYLFPDFSRYKERFMTRGIHNSRDLCDKLLTDTGAALLPSFDFRSPSEELTVRLSYVDFDGEKALKVVAAEYTNKSGGALNVMLG